MRSIEKSEETDKILNHFMQEGLFRLPDYNDPKHNENLFHGRLILGDEDFHSMKLDDLARKVDTDPTSSLFLDSRVQP